MHGSRLPEFFSVTPKPGWGNAAPKIENENELKQAFGIELAKDHKSPFEAALVVFDGDTSKAMWAVGSWLADPIVNATKDLYLKKSEEASKLLDKEQLAARLLEFADEKLPHNLSFFAHEAKDRLKAYELYAKVRGYTDKVEIDNSTKNFVDNRQMIVKFVKPQSTEEEKPKIIEHSEVINEEINPLPISIKLVNAS